MSYNGYRAGEEIVGVNPKVNNLMEAYRAAKHDFIDSNVSVVPDALLRSLASFNSKSPTAPV